MHPEILRMMAAQRIEQSLAIAEADRRARQSRLAGQRLAHRSRRPRLLPARRRVAAECPAPHRT
jgi:hypothetical protein